MALPNHSQQLPPRIGRDSSSDSPVQQGKIRLGDEEYDYEDLEYIEGREFRQLVMEGKWGAVAYVYQKRKEFHKMDLKRRGTALHAAVNTGNEEAVKDLVNAILQHDKSALAWQNKQVATPLHLAARRGLTNICKCIVGSEGDRKQLIQEKDKNNGETPLFWAVLHGKVEAFKYLQHVAPLDINIQVTNKNDTILHAAIRREFFDLAAFIIRRDPLLSYQRNADDVTPLEVLVTKPSAFESGMNLSWWKKILYHWISLDQSKIKSVLDPFEDVGNKEKEQHQVSIPLGPSVLKTSLDSEKADRARYTLVPPNWVPCIWFVYYFHKLVFRCLCLSRLGIKGVDLKAIEAVKEKHLWGRMLLDEFMKSPFECYEGRFGLQPTADEERDRVLEILRARDQIHKEAEENEEKETTFLAVAKSGITEIMNELNTKTPSAPEDVEKEGLLLVAMKKIKHETESVEKTDKQEDIEKEGLLLMAMKKIKHETESVEKTDKQETAYLAAARTGIVEIVSELQDEIPSVIHDTTSNKENVLLVAVKNRQPLVVDALRTKLDQKLLEGLIYETDIMDNNVLHLAAGAVGGNEKTWQIAGAAMQMMWDIKWYQYINELVPKHFAFRINKEGKTPGAIFKEKHEELVKESSEWMKETSNSCSVVAALIAGVSFATASTVPGGTENGKPALEGQPAFDAFAIASLVGLCFSVTALIMFLAILTSRKQAEDFKRSLPIKLLFGLSSLFLSIASMLIAFCAGHFFVLKDKYKSILFPIYVATCLPVTFFAVVQFPLYADLVKAIFKKMPPPSGKGVQL